MLQKVDPDAFNKDTQDRLAVKDDVFTDEYKVGLRKDDVCKINTMLCNKAFPFLPRS